MTHSDEIVDRDAIRGWLDDATIRIVHDPDRVQVLRLPRCGDCGHRHVWRGNGKCAEAYAALCSCCPVTWPSVAEVMAVSGRTVARSEDDLD